MGEQVKLAALTGAAVAAAAATTASHARRAGAITRARHHAAAWPRPATLGAAGRRARPPSLAVAPLPAQARAVPHARAS